MTNLTKIKTKLPEALILEFLNSSDDCTIDLMMLIELEIYKRKENAVRQLITNFESGIDYSQFSADRRKTPEGGRPSDSYLLTSDCFKHLCMMAKTPMGKLVRTYYIAVEKRWRQELLQKQAQKRSQTELPSVVETVQSENIELKAEIDRVVEEWLRFIPKLVRLTDHCFGLIGRQGEDQKVRLLNKIDKGVTHEELQYLATDAVDQILHTLSHQPSKVKKLVREQIEPYREKFAQILVAQLMELQALSQPALPPAEEFPVRRTSAERRRAVIEFIFELVDRYGSLDAIPRRGQGKAGIDLEVEWGTMKLSQMFGVSPHSVLNAWREVKEAIAEYGVAGARHRLL